jgi:hypothetical protein
VSAPTAEARAEPRVQLGSPGCGALKRVATLRQLALNVATHRVGAATASHGAASRALHFASV